MARQFESVWDLTSLSYSVQGDCVTCDVTYGSDGETMGDTELFLEMKGAMKILNFSDQEQFELWKIVATIMHLGNIVFLGLFKVTNTTAPMSVLCWV